MIDYILSFPSESIAQLAMADWRTTASDGSSTWRPKPQCGIHEITVINQEVVWDNSDAENPIIATPEIKADGFWMTIATPQINESLWAQAFVLSEHDRSLSATNHHLLRTKLSPQQIAGVVNIRPVFAGSKYPF